MATEPESKVRVDAELDARLSRINSEISQVRQLAESDEASKRGLREVEEKLLDTSTQRDHATRILAVHEIEAMLCMLKPEQLLYPTWIRLRERLYRLKGDRRSAWERDLTEKFSKGGNVRQSQVTRQRLRQLTLELQEAAASYNRLANERAEVIRDVNKFGIVVVVVFLITLVVCFVISNMQVSASLTITVVLIACAIAGGMAATFGRLTTIRRERARYPFSETFKWDIAARVCLGAVSALFIAAALLSGFLPISVPEGATERLSFLVLFGFGAGFSDRLFNQTLEKVIGSRAPQSPSDST